MAESRKQTLSIEILSLDLRIEWARRAIILKSWIYIQSHTIPTSRSPEFDLVEILTEWFCFVGFLFLFSACYGTRYLSKPEPRSKRDVWWVWMFFLFFFWRGEGERQHICLIFHFFGSLYISHLLLAVMFDGVLIPWIEFFFEGVEREKQHIPPIFHLSSSLSTSSISFSQNRALDLRSESFSLLTKDPSLSQRRCLMGFWFLESGVFDLFGVRERETGHPPPSSMSPPLSLYILHILLAGLVLRLFLARLMMLVCEALISIYLGKLR